MVDQIDMKMVETSARIDMRTLRLETSARIDTHLRLGDLGATQARICEQS